MKCWVKKPLNEAITNQKTVNIKNKQSKTIFNIQVFQCKTKGSSGTTYYMVSSRAAENMCWRFCFHRFNELVNVSRKICCIVLGWTLVIDSMGNNLIFSKFPI